MIQGDQVGGVDHVVRARPAAFADVVDGPIVVIVNIVDSPPTIAPGNPVADKP